MAQATTNSEIEQVKMVNSEIEQVKMDVTCSSSETSTVCHDHSSKEGGKVREVRQSFPCKVYDMLQNADSQDFRFIVSWNAEGSGFTVHNKDLFTSKIVPKYFNQTKYKSFQRQLSLYGFQRITMGKNRGLRYHEKLLRGSRQFCREMKPIAYKPRGPETRENQAKQAISNAYPKAGSSSLSMTDWSQSMSSSDSSSDGELSLPAVVSSRWLCKAEQDRESYLISPDPTKSCTSDSSEDVGTFEGKSFYLMGLGDESEPEEPHREAYSDNLSQVLVDVQLEKAWEFDFVVAMTMNPTSCTAVVETACVDVLDIHALEIPLS
jgi:hypothetical protein